MLLKTCIYSLNDQQEGFYIRLISIIHVFHTECKTIAGNGFKCISLALSSGSIGGFPKIIKHRKKEINFFSYTVS